MSDREQEPAPFVLVVDDDGTFRTVLARSLRSRGYDTDVAGSYDEAITRVMLSAPQVALVDLHMPERSGFELIDAIKRIDPTTVFIVLTADQSRESMEAAAARGVFRYLTKPTDADEVIAALEAARALT
ncbi:MAG TPA: response regulator [Polyangia bacterium]|nr:response regulator [Polyangia bacterium]